MLEPQDQLNLFWEKWKFPCPDLWVDFKESFCKDQRVVTHNETETCEIMCPDEVSHNLEFLREVSKKSI